MKRFTYGVVGGYVSNRFYSTERGAKNAATREHGNSVNLQVGYISNSLFRLLNAACIA